MDKIIIKEIDRLYSKLHGGRVVSEYIIYFYKNDVIIELHTELGDLAKQLRVNELMIVNSITNKEIIQEITLEEVLKNQN
jgi:hypothetical protein